MALDPFLLISTTKKMPPTSRTTTLMTATRTTGNSSSAGAALVALGTTQALGVAAVSHLVFGFTSLQSASAAHSSGALVGHSLPAENDADPKLPSAPQVNVAVAKAPPNVAACVQVNTTSAPAASVVPAAAAGVPVAVPPVRAATATASELPSQVRTQRWVEASQRLNGTLVRHSA